MKKYLIGAALLSAAGVVPIVPEEMELAYSYQYSAGEYKPMLGSGNNAYPNPAPDFKDHDNNGLVSVSSFIDRNGEETFVRIPDTQYAEMGAPEGAKKNPKKSELVSLLELSTPAAEAAITYDTAVNGGCSAGSSLTYAHTVTGTLPIIHVGGLYDAHSVTSVTYNGAALSLVAGPVPGSSSRVALYEKVGPSTGTNNVVWTHSSGPPTLCVKSISHAGAASTGNPITTTTTNTSGTSCTASLTTTTGTQWGVMVAYSGGGDTTSGTRFTRRIDNGDPAIGDSAAALPSGATSMVSTANSGSFSCAAAVFDEPAAAPAASAEPSLMIFH